MVLMESRWLPHQSHGQCEEDEDEEENVLLEDRDKEERMRIMGQVLSCVDVLLLLGGGRPLYCQVSALSGAISRLSRALLDLLRHRIIYRKEKRSRRGKERRDSIRFKVEDSSSSDEEENCVPFIAARLTKLGIKSPPESERSLKEWLKDRLLDCSLSETLALLLCDPLEVRPHFDRGAVLRSRFLCACAVAVLAHLETQDARGFSDFGIKWASLTNCGLVDEEFRECIMRKWRLLEQQGRTNLMQKFESHILAEENCTQTCLDQALQRQWSSPSQQAAGEIRERLGARPKKSQQTSSNADLSKSACADESAAACTSCPDLADSGSSMERVASCCDSSQRRPTRASRKTHHRSSSDTVSYLVNDKSKEEEEEEELLVEIHQARPSVFSPSLSSSPPLSVASSEPFSADPPSPPAGGWRPPRPRSRQQSLASYIADGEFSRHQARLDRENAHLILSEAVMQAINQANFEKRTKLPKILPTSDNLDPEGRDFLVLGLRRLEVQEDGVTSPTFSDELSDEEEATEEQNSLDPPAPSGAVKGATAEALALSLLNAICREDRELPVPRVADLDWLVGAGDTDQPPERESVISLPGSCSDLLSDLRGNEDWAPPRPQLILKIHQKKKVSVGVLEQNFICRGCGVSVSEKYAKTFRRCAYFGAFFCTGCHKNEKSIIPANIVERWSFRQEPVSSFARSVILSLSHSRLFDLETMNPQLVRKVAGLRKALQARKEAASVFPYVLTCSNRDVLRDLVIRVEAFADLDSPNLTLSELCAIKLGTYNKRLCKAVEEAKDHVRTCESCHLRGHICEGCHSDEVLFPFSSSPLVAQCGRCGACYHSNCFQGRCGRCQRIEQRRRMKADATKLRVNC